MGPDFDGDGVVDAAGQILTTYGKWEAGRTAGGCRNDLKSFAANPQYLLVVHEIKRNGRGVFDVNPDQGETALSYVRSEVSEGPRWP